MFITIVPTICIANTLNSNCHPSEVFKTAFILCLSFACGQAPKGLYETVCGTQRSTTLNSHQAALLYGSSVLIYRSSIDLTNITHYYARKSTNMWSNELVPDVSKPPDKGHTSGKQMDSEFLLVAMERVTTLFDRIKKAYPFEAEIVCEILPGFLMEFFPVQEILNKIITEFLSSQQPHPQLMAKVIFEVFQYLHKQSQEEVIHEWVLLSLSNFMQRSPLSMAIWSLSCFFVSATKNYWFQALFPHIQNRMGKMEEQDRVLFCIAGVNFRDQGARDHGPSEPEMAGTEEKKF
ncbi:huntingtin [Trichonephila inaurata madagascariensis]|uniref:Huntingtin n=1 Tax=Trichonephila inaurata madagascariensis TaxID=2747483 RepID=A0A8X6IIH9_9ARAC|nr:huntingtin [Trichonephila inaurata madagascariensis]